MWKEGFLPKLFPGMLKIKYLFMGIKRLYLRELISQGGISYKIGFFLNEDNLDNEGFPQNEELLSVGVDAYTLIKTGDIEWDDDIHNELLEALDKNGLQSVTDIEFDWEEDDLENLFPVLWERFGEEPLG